MELHDSTANRVGFVMERLVCDEFQVGFERLENKWILNEALKGKRCWIS